MSIKYALLGILNESPKHGYDLKRAFDEKLGEFWNLNYGQIYTTLEKLETAGLVEFDPIAQVDKPDKKVYRITEAGVEELNVWRSQPLKSEPRVLRDELFLKIMFMDVRQPEMVLAEVRAHQSAYLAYMMQLTNRKFHLEQAARRAAQATADPAERERIEHDRLISTVLIDAALFHAEADIRWLKHCEAKIVEGNKR